jgi:hypothetical protein
MAVAIESPSENRWDLRLIPFRNNSYLERNPELKRLLSQLAHHVGYAPTRRGAAGLEYSGTY